MEQEHPINQLISSAIANGIFPQASLSVASHGVIHWDQTYACRKDQLFDISSLTKPIATATLMMIAVCEGKLDIDDPIDPLIAAKEQTGITFKNLLNHSSGLPAWKPYHEDIFLMHRSWVGDVAAKRWILYELLKEVYSASSNQKIVYSDLGYMLLGFLLEEIYQEELAVLFEKKVANPLQLGHTCFNPLAHKIRPEDIIPTENCPWRKKILQGIVMDGSAYVMGGAAGHAGLFSTAGDIIIWLGRLKDVLNNASDFIDRGVLEQFIHMPSDKKADFIYFTPGFDTPSQNSSAGRYLSPHSIGHLGFTGTSFWWDLERDLQIVFLTNRVHPDRHNRAIQDFRPQLHDCIVTSLGMI